MKITFISNYINHHQIPFSDALYQMIGSGYHFIQTEPMEEERRQMGWDVEISEIPYVSVLREDEKHCKQLLLESDILLVGWMDREDLIKERMLSEKLTIRISERLYREGQWKAVSPRGLWKKYQDHTRFRKDPVYLLCAGGYVPSDFAIIHAYKNKMFRFGYFPETMHYSSEELEQMKPKGETIHLVWAGRFLPLKHPEFVPRLAIELNKSGFNYHIHFIGNGEMYDKIHEEICEHHLEDKVTLYGFLKPNEVRRIMEKSHIHLFTSNYLEGWGAVINEAMNSACAVVVNSEVGAAPFLIQHGKNGLIYKEGSYDDFEKQVLFLFDHPSERIALGLQAYKTIVTAWNAEYAAEQLMRFYRNWQKGQVRPPKEGPFAIAPVVTPKNMYHYLMESGSANGRTDEKGTVD